MDIRLEATKIIRQRKPQTMGGIFDCAKADGKTTEEAWDIADYHYKHVKDDIDYRVTCRYKAYIEGKIKDKGRENLYNSQSQKLV